MLSRKKDFIKIDNLSSFTSFSDALVRFLMKIDVLALTLTKSLCLVLMRLAETSLMKTAFKKNTYSFWLL